MRALDYKETARSHGQVDRAIESASDDVEGLLHRRFYPTQATRSFDWPNGSYSRSWRLWLDKNELISITTLVTGGQTLTQGSDYFLRRADDLDEPPYTQVQINLAGNAAFGGGPTTQRDIAITGLYGYNAVERPTGALAGSVDDSTATVDLTATDVGIGNVIHVGTERMLVTGRRMLDTGQDLAADVAASNAATSVPVADGTAYGTDEIILIDGERMLIIDIAGNNLIVKRGWDGSVLAAHTSGTDIYAARRLTVERGALGTTAASHSTSATVYRHLPPALVRDLCIAEAMDQLLQEPAGYARAGTVQDNSHNGISVSNIRSSKYQLGVGIDGLRDRTRNRYGRMARVRAV